MNHASHFNTFMTKIDWDWDWELRHESAILRLFDWELGFFFRGVLRILPVICDEAYLRK